MKTLTRYQCRQISRNRLRIKALNPCAQKFQNPFAHLLNSMNIEKQELSQEEKQIQHEVRMAKQKANALKRKKQLARRKKS